MVKKFGIPMRVDEELQKVIDNIARENRVSKRIASRYIARAMMDKKIKKEKLIDEIRF